MTDSWGEEKKEREGKPGDMEGSRKQVTREGLSRKQGWVIVSCLPKVEPNEEIKVTFGLSTTVPGRWHERAGSSRGGEGGGRGRRNGAS